MDKVKDITDEDIENQWYVKLLKGMKEHKENKTGEENHKK